MKLLFLTLVSCFVLSFPVIVEAGDKDQPFDPVNMNTTIEYLGNGNYMETTITPYNEGINTRASTTTASKSVSYKNSKGTVLWSYKITASFTYTGTSATCISVSNSNTINDKAWSITSSSVSKNGNRASGKVTAVERMFGITIDTVSRTLTLTCSPTGKLS